MLFDTYTGIYFDIDELISYSDFESLIDILQNKLNLKNVIYAGYSND